MVLVVCKGCFFRYESYLRKYKKNKYFFLSVGVIVFIFSMVMFLFAFFQQLRETEVERCKDELIEVSIKGTTILKNQLDFATDVLEASSMLVTNIDRSINEDAVLRILNEIRINSDFERVGITNSEGDCLLSSGLLTNVKNKEYFKRSMEGEAYITNVFESMLKENLKIFIISVPIYEGEEVFGVLYGVIETNQLSEIYNSHEHISERYFHIVDHKGDYVLKSNHDNVIFKKENLWEDLADFDFEIGYDLTDMKLNFQQNKAGLDYVLKSNHDNVIFKKENLWEDLADFDFEIGYDLTDMKLNFQQNKAGLIGYSKGNESRFCYYMPLDINGWYILSHAPQESVYEHVGEVNKLLFNLGVKVAFAIFLFVALLYLFNLTQYYEMRKRNEELMITSEVLKIATNEITNGIFEYDVHTKVVSFKNDYYKVNGLSEIIADVPDALIARGRVCEDSAPVFKQLFEKMVYSRKRESAEVCVNSERGKV